MLNESELIKSLGNESWNRIYKEHGSEIGTEAFVNVLMKKITECTVTKKTKKKEAQRKICTQGILKYTQKPKNPPKEELRRKFKSY